MVNICIPEFGYSLILALGQLTYGYVLGFPSPVLPQLHKEFPNIDEQYFTFFNSVSALLAITGPLVAVVLLSPKLPLGRKKTTFVIAVAGTLLWGAVLGTARSIWIGIAARAGLGIVMGAFSAVVPMYIVELSPPEARTMLGTLPQLFLASGVVIVNLEGVFLNWRWIALIGAGIDLALCCLIWIVPESPAVGEIANTEVGEPLCSQKWMAKALIACSIMLFRQLTGVNAIITNLTYLFKEAGLPINAGYSSAIGSAGQVVSCLFAGMVIGALSRKIVWIISYAGIAVTDFAYGFYTYPSSHGEFPKLFPIFVIFLNLLFFGIGAGPLSWFLVPEMFPTAIRPAANSMAVMCNWLAAFGVIQGFPTLTEYLGEWGAFILFAAISFVAAVFGLFYVQNPEVEEQRVHKQIYDDLISS
jgi:MFS family permease